MVFFSLPLESVMERPFPRVSGVKNQNFLAPNPGFVASRLINIMIFSKIRSDIGMIIIIFFSLTFSENHAVCVPVCEMGDGSDNISKLLGIRHAENIYLLIWTDSSFVYS
jgi:hypothetical protein